MWFLNDGVRRLSLKYQYISTISCECLIAAFVTDRTRVRMQHKVSNFEHSPLHYVEQCTSSISKGVCTHSSDRFVCFIVHQLRKKVDLTYLFLLSKSLNIVNPYVGICDTCIWQFTRSFQSRDINFFPVLTD